MLPDEKSRESQQPPPLDVSGMPEFARAIRGIAHVPKAEVDAHIARERKKKSAKRSKPH